MCPRRVDPNVDYRRIGELSEEFSSLWTRLHGFYLDASVGFNVLHDRVANYQSKIVGMLGDDEMSSQEFLDELTFSYSDIFSGSFVCFDIHRVKQGDVRRRNLSYGKNFSILGQLCVVSFYDYWEEHLRREYVIAIGHLNADERNKEMIDNCCRKYACHNLWGDIRHLRTSIVHNLGVATSDVKRCQIIRWFNPGDDIYLPPDRMRTIFIGMLKYRNELFAQQFPEHYIVL